MAVKEKDGDGVNRYVLAVYIISNGLWRING